MPIYTDKFTSTSTAYSNKFASVGTTFSERLTDTTEYLATQALEILTTESGDYLVSKGQTYKDKFI